jgi:two-component system, chemotaxis family, chemotaxis protein CheY
MRRVMIVEDNADLRQVLAELLANVGYQVTCAANGHEALARLRGRPGTPHLILLDLVMPRMDGLRFLKELRATPARNVPAIVMTGMEDADLADRIGHPVVLKPDLDGLVPLVGRQIRRGPARAPKNERSGLRRIVDNA